jgi:transposase
MPTDLTQRPTAIVGMSFAIELSDEQWELVADLFDPAGRRGAPAEIARRVMVDAILFIARTGIQWRKIAVRPRPLTSWCLPVAQAACLRDG